MKLDSLTGNRLRTYVLLGGAAVICISLALSYFLDREERAFEKIRVGMPRAEVENLFGKRKGGSWKEFGYYGDVRIEEWQSPVSVHRIRVDYSNGCVIDKHFFSDQAPPWRKRAMERVWNTATNLFR
jgi:hypothetical protein